MTSGFGSHNQRPPEAQACSPDEPRLNRLGRLRGISFWGLLGPFGAFWGLLGPLGPFGAFWGLLGPFGAFWGLLGPFGAFWGLLGPFGVRVESPNSPEEQQASILDPTNSKPTQAQTQTPEP